MPGGGPCCMPGGGPCCMPGGGTCCMPGGILGGRTCSPGGGPCCMPGGGIPIICGGIICGKGSIMQEVDGGGDHGTGTGISGQVGQLIQGPIGFRATAPTVLLAAILASSWECNSSPACRAVQGKRAQVHPSWVAVLPDLGPEARPCACPGGRRGTEADYQGACPVRIEGGG